MNCLHVNPLKMPMMELIARLSIQYVYSYVHTHLLITYNRSRRVGRSSAPMCGRAFSYIVFTVNETDDSKIIQKEKSKSVV